MNKKLLLKIILDNDSNLNEKLKLKIDDYLDLNNFSFIICYISYSDKYGEWSSSVTVDKDKYQKKLEKLRIDKINKIND